MSSQKLEYVIVQRDLGVLFDSSLKSSPQSSSVSVKACQLVGVLRRHFLSRHETTMMRLLMHMSAQSLNSSRPFGLHHLKKSRRLQCDLVSSFKIRAGLITIDPGPTQAP